MELWRKVTCAFSDPTVEAQYRKAAVREFQDLHQTIFFYLCVTIFVWFFISFNHMFQASYLLLCSFMVISPIMMSIISLAKNHSPTSAFAGSFATGFSNPPTPVPPATRGSPSPSPSSSGPPALPERVRMMLRGGGAGYRQIDMEDQGSSSSGLRRSSSLSQSPSGGVRQPPPQWNNFVVFLGWCQRKFGSYANSGLVVWNFLGGFGYFSFMLTILLEQALCGHPKEGEEVSSMTCIPISRGDFPPHLVFFMTVAPISFGVLLMLNWAVVSFVNILLIIVQFAIFSSLVNEPHLWFITCLLTLWMAHCSFSLRKGEIQRRRDYVNKVNYNKQVNKLDEAKKKAQEAHDQKQYFVAYIFHEVRVQFHNLTLGLDWLYHAKVARSGEELETLTSMGAAANLMNRMLDDVLDLAKLEDGSFSPKKAPIDYIVLVREIVKNFQAKAKKKSITMAPDETHPSVCLVCASPPPPPSVALNPDSFVLAA